MPRPQHLARSPNSLIAGVCAGIAEYYGWSVQRVRIGYVLLSLLSAAFPGLLVYSILWFIIPLRPSFHLEDFQKQ